MEYDVSIDHETKIIQATCTGPLDISSTREMAKELRKQAYDLGYGLLYDMTGATIAVSLAQAYAFPRDIRNVYHHPKHRFGRAAIYYKPGKDEEFWTFYENTARNTGGLIKVFDDRDRALEWLSEEISR